MNREGDNSNETVEKVDAPLFLRRHESEPEGAAASGAGAAGSVAKPAPTVSSVGDAQARQQQHETVAEGRGETAASKSFPDEQQLKGKRKAETGKPAGEPAAAKKGARKSWKKPEGMPKRPLSAYNLYFRSERQALLGEDMTKKEYGVADPTKRKHRKTHGKISFQDMAQIISEKWKSMPKGDRLPFERQAGEEKRRYREALDLWKAQQRLAADGDIVRKVSLEKSASEEQQATADAAAAAGSSGDDGSGDGTNDESESDDQDSGEGGDSDSDGGNDKRKADADDSDSDGDANVDAGEAPRRQGGKTGKRKKTAGTERGGVAAAALGPTSPRSETAALLVAMPNTGSVAGIMAPGNVSSGFASASVPAMMQGGMMALSNPLGLSGMYAPADATERVVRDSALLLGFPHPFSLPARYLPSMQPSAADYQHARVNVAAPTAATAASTTAATLREAGGNQSVQQRYSSLMAEAAVLRMEMEREHLDGSSTSPSANQPQQSAMIPPRRHSDGMMPASYYPMELRRFSDNPRTLSLLRAQQQMPLQQANLERSSYMGMPQAMMTEGAYQPALPSPPLQFGTSPGPNQATIEQAQLDVFALQRAADLRRADIARWNQQAASPAMVPRSSPPATWAVSSEALPAPMAAQTYQMGAPSAQYFMPNPMELAQYAHGLHLHQAARLHNPTFQVVSQADVPSGPAAAQAVQVYPAPLGPFHLRAPAAGEPIPPDPTGAAQPPAPSPPQGPAPPPPPGWR